jgi:uncharacterized repeat protein (TIGR03837 family)
MHADIFCRVIDNLGDMGVTWRLARQLAHEKNWHIRLWIDNPEALKRIAPHINAESVQQTVNGIDIRHWPAPWEAVDSHPIVIASFSCDLPEAFMQQMAKKSDTQWLALEYLSAEPWVEHFHGGSSKRADGLAPVFFFPGFTSKTGGLLREEGLMAQRQAWQNDRAQQRQWLKHLGVHVDPDHQLGLVFTYAWAPHETLLKALAQTGSPWHLLIPEQAPWSLIEALPTSARVSWQRIPFVPQTDLDKLLWSMDLNCVRGEDSFVRAIWAGKPLIWQIYPQAERAHHPKLQAWLDMAQLPDAVTIAMRDWADGQPDTDLRGLFTAPIWAAWQQASLKLTQQLSDLPDLASQIDAHCRRSAKSI